MFSKSRMILMATVLLLLLLSTQSVLANFTNGPLNPGKIIVRGEDIFLLSTEDYKAGLTAIHNGDVVEYCQGNEEPAVLIDYQDIYSPKYEDRIIEILHGEDVPTTVWPFAVDWEDENWCDMFLTNDPIATGTAKLRATDNDVYAWTYTDNKHSNAFGWTSQGLLYSLSDEPVRFSSVYREVWDGIDGSRVANFVSKINIK
jgi:hypothetical protein